MNAKLFYLLQELKDNFSKELLNETYECFMNETHNFYNDSVKSKELLNGQSNEFYNKIASDFVNDLEDFPEMFFLSWQSVFEHFSKETMDKFNELSLLIDNNSDATDYFLLKIKFLAKCKREFTTKFAIVQNACCAFVFNFSLHIQKQGLFHFCNHCNYFLS